MKRLVDILAAISAFTGLIASCYLIFEHYRLVGRQAALLAQACPIDAGSCSAVTESPEFTILGIPYSVIGGAYFAFLVGTSLYRLHWGRWPVPHGLTTILTGSLVFSLYLIYLMFEVAGEVCPYCITAHAANAAFFILYGASLHKETDGAQRQPGGVMLPQ